MVKPYCEYCGAHTASRPECCRAAREKRALFEATLLTAVFMWGAALLVCGITLTVIRLYSLI